MTAGWKDNSRSLSPRYIVPGHTCQWQDTHQSMYLLDNHQTVSLKPSHYSHKLSSLTHIHSLNHTSTCHAAFSCVRTQRTRALLREPLTESPRLFDTPYTPTLTTHSARSHTHNTTYTANHYSHHT